MSSATAQGSTTGATRSSSPSARTAAEVAKAGDMAYTWGMFNFTYQDSTGTEKTSYGKYLNVWKKQEDGTWKVVVDMGN